VRYQFGNFSADLDTRQLMRGDCVVHLSPKAFDLLVTLIKERPRALPKAELHTRLWPQTFVSDTSLAMLVAETRAALDDHVRAPTFIRTVHRHGYAFCGSAVEVAATSVGSDGLKSGCWLIGSPRNVQLLVGETIVGRDPQSEVWLDSPSVSRRHARITVSGTMVTLEDLQSKNGTERRGEPVTLPVQLEDGDEIRFGSVAMTCRIWSPNASTKSGTDL
jgi:DNA-binding winged helix-turn-helix (wHTH) protein